jgi:hypothetical protein
MYLPDKKVYEVFPLRTLAPENCNIILKTKDLREDIIRYSRKPAMNS